VVSATNSAGCSDTDSILVSISDFSLSTYDIIIPLYDTIYQYQTLQINTVTGTAFSYQWNPETWLDNPHSSDPIASPLVTTSYYVYVTDSFGCLRIDSFTVFVLDILCNDVYVFVPNAFSPNNDQVNDILYIQSYLVKDLYFVIFDRWGEKVFETTDVSKGWDGRYKGKLLDPAVFVYYMKATCMNDVVFEKKGNITLLR
jgi:gliding motility-associated-like protein